MAEITRRRQGELVRGIFEILLVEPEGLRARDVLERLEQVVPPTEFERSNYPNRPNVRRYEKIARFSTIGPVKAGWLIKNKGSSLRRGARGLPRLS
jgi:restriction system protein